MTSIARNTRAPAAKRSRAEAAVIAAQQFNPGRKSLFETARVTGAALKQALRDVAQRIVLSTPGIAPTSTVTIVFAGEGAYVRHEWKHVNRAGELAISAAIFLPDVDDLASIPRALCDEMLAMMLHELAHAFYTSPSDFSRGIWRLAQAHGVPQERAKDIVNAMEDVRIERALMASGYAAGFRGCVGALLARIMAGAIDGGALRAMAAGDVTAFGFALAYGLRRTPAGAPYVIGAEYIPQALSARLKPVYDMVSDSIYSIPANDKGTAAIVALADRVFTMLREQGQPQPGDQPGDKPGQPGDKPQPPQDGPQGQPCDDGEPGDGEQGQPQPGDKPGDKPGDGEPGDEGQPQPGDKPGDDGDGEPGDDGEGEGQPGDGDADAPAGDDGDDEGEGRTSTSGLPTGDSATDEPLPAPDTFSSEPTIMDIPDACKATTESVIFEPRIKPPFDVTPEGLARGQQALADAAAAAKGNGGALVMTLRRLFSRSDRDALESGRKHGRIHARALHRVATGADNIFAKRELVDGENAACAVLIDGSESMLKHSVAEMANGASLLLVQALAKCPGVKTQVQVFQDGYARGDAIAQVIAGASDLGIRGNSSPFDLVTVKGFNDGPATAYANARAIAGGCTPDLEALAAVGRSLAKRKEGRKVLLFIADGGTGRSDAIAKECAHLERLGVAVVAIGIKHDCSGFPRAVRVNNMSELAGVAMRQACDAIARQFGDGM